MVVAPSSPLTSSQGRGVACVLQVVSAGPPGISLPLIGSRVRYQYNQPPSLAKRSWMNFASLGYGGVSGMINVASDLHLGA